MDVLVAVRSLLLVVAIVVGAFIVMALVTMVILATVGDIRPVPIR